MMLTILGSAGTEAWVSGAATVHIPKPTFTNVAAANRAQGRRLESGALISPRTRSTSPASAASTCPTRCLAEDALEIPWPLIDQLRSRQAYELAKQIGLRRSIRGSSAAAASGPARRRTSPTARAGTNFIARTSPWRGKNDASNKLVYDAIEAFELYLQRADALDGIGDAVGQKWMVMPPEVFRALRCIC